MSLFQNTKTFGYFMVFILCLSHIALANQSIENLFKPAQSKQGKNVGGLTTRNMGVMKRSDILGGLSLVPRDCYSGYSECRYTGRCCPDPYNHCCPSGTCVTGEQPCCGNSHACDVGESCCYDGCMPKGQVCCDVKHYCNAPDECCENSCMTQGYNCCSNGQSCEPDNVCIIRDGEMGCCPREGCYSYENVIYWYVYVYWYIEIYWEVRVKVTTSTVSLTSSSERTSSTLSLRASRSDALYSSYSSLSSSIVEAASTTPDLHDLPTSTTTTSNPTAVPTGSGSGSNTDSDTTFPSNRSTFPSETGQGDVPLSGGGAGGAGGTGSIIGPSVFVALVGATFVLMILL
ncbi:putative GPI anchored protein [Aspergillus tanneri]|uniref:Granulins domain-containing protein n=1 Tax=Aspergillus tanneri TaxID=1220188 RepID=A0A5M9MMD4_9EURO|nr:uncharacterized protein ATNIH1004_005739 [Aspergillus tanneri]KAA8647056.1 hypothetical protein ATNIH1004_005739 [Aspergillus tanneri]